MAAAKATTDADTIRKWVEARGGRPATVKATGDEREPGILRIDFPGYGDDDKLEPLSWEKFFEAFEANGLAFLYQDGKKSRFNKFVSRDNVSNLEESEDEEADEDEDEDEDYEEAEAVDPIEMLKEQHREVEALFEDHEKAKNGRSKRTIFGRIADALAAHCAIEEELFYPTVMNDKTEEGLREAVEEHLQAKRLIADLLGMSTTDPQWDGKISVLREEIEHHVEEEENELFPKLEKIDDETMDTLGAQMAERWNELMQERNLRDRVPQETSAAAPLD